MTQRWPDSRFPPPPLTPQSSQIPHPNPYNYLHSAHPPLHTHIPSSSHSLYPNPNPNPSYPAVPAPTPQTETFKPLHYSVNAKNYSAAGNPFAPHGGYAVAGPSPITNLQQHTPATATAMQVPAGLVDYYYERSRIGGGRGEAYVNRKNENKFALKEAIRQYGADPSHHSTVSSSYVHGHQISAGPFSAQAQMALPHSTPLHNGAQKAKPKKTSSTTNNTFHCDVCNIDCNSKTVFITHEQGKKHKINLETLKGTIKQEPVTAGASTKPDNKTDASGIGSNKKKSKNKKDSIAQKPETTQASTTQNKKEKNNENLIAQKPETNGKAETLVLGTIQNKRRNDDAPEEDLETKKKRVLKAGAEPSQVKVCEICNAVANSQIVFESHLSGLKHIENVKKLQAAS